MVEAQPYNGSLALFGVPRNVVVIAPKREGDCLMSMLQPTPVEHLKQHPIQPHPLEVL